MSCRIQQSALMECLTSINERHRGRNSNSGPSCRKEKRTVMPKSTKRKLVRAKSELVTPPDAGCRVKASPTAGSRRARAPGQQKDQAQTDVHPQSPGEGPSPNVTQADFRRSVPSAPRSATHTALSPHPWLATSHSPLRSRTSRLYQPPPVQFKSHLRQIAYIV